MDLTVLERTLFLLPGERTYFCLASQMALLGFISIKRKSLHENSRHLLPQLGPDPIKLFSASIEATLEFQNIRKG